MFRPLSFDYRSKLPNHRWRDWWDKSLFISGLIPAVMFGLVFGNLLKGIPFHLDSDMRIFYLGDFMGLLNPFALLVSVVSAAMLIMHGAVFLQVKTEGDIQVAAKVMVTRFAMIALVAFAIAGFWVMRLEGYHIKSEVVMNAVSNPLAKFVRRSDGLWLDNYEHYFALWLIPLLAFIAGGLTIWLSKKDKADLAFISSAVMLGSIILTASVSMFPFLIPSNISLNTSLTIWDASASQKTLLFLLWGTLIFLPIVLIYTQWVFKILRGKVTTEQIQQNTHSLY
jgi:cytochrome d ubiquinol oxidase subunit II